MKLVLLFASLIFCSATFANPLRPGAPVKTELSCKPIRAPKNLSVKLEILKAAVSPEFNIKGVTLVKMKFDPLNGNPQTKSVLKQKSQTAYTASFIAKDVVVDIDKSPLEASVNLGIAEYFCK